MDPQRPPPALSSDLLEEIFLRVASPADLARASTACSSFHRLIADHAFLRRYRSIHPPLLLGFVGFLGFHPAEAPHPSAAVARSVASSFSLPHSTTGHHSWHPCDVRDGRVLLERRCGLLVHFELLVCDPLYRRSLPLPPITDDLVASIGMHDENISETVASFIPSGGMWEDASFRVIHWIQSCSRLGVFIFSSDSGSWSVSTSVSWDDLGLDEIYLFNSGQYMNDCFYWKSDGINMLVKLDMNSMRFCTIGLPPDHNKREIIIVESGESRVAMFSMMLYEGTSVDYYTFSQNGSEKSHEWHLKSTIPLPDHTCVGNFGGPVEGYIFIELKCISDEPDTTYSAFSLEIKSSNIERVRRISSFGTRAYPYFGFPPFMSPRRI